jgi:hypothetical protein
MDDLFDADPGKTAMTMAEALVNASDAALLKTRKPARATALYEGWSGDPASLIDAWERDEEAIRERWFEALQ